MASGGTSPANSLVIHFQPPDGETMQLCCLSCPFLGCFDPAAPALPEIPKPGFSSLSCIQVGFPRMLGSSPSVSSLGPWG